MSTRILGFGIIITGLVLLTIGLIIGIGFPNFVFHENLKNACILSRTHPMYDSWVNETYFTTVNRIYYWELTNSEDFLYKAATPRVKQVGPYVYLERRKKIDVNFVSTTTQFRLWRQQIFDDTATKAECGPSCGEFDQITILNPDYLRLVGRHGDVNSTLNWLPSVISEEIVALTLQNNSRSRVMSQMGLLNSSTFESRNVTVTARGLYDVSFGAWIGRNDTENKASILGQRNGVGFSALEMSGLYDLLTNKTLFGEFYKEQDCDITNSTVGNFPGVSFSFWTVLLMFREAVHFPGTTVVPGKEFVAKDLLRYAAVLLCLDPSRSCFQLPMDDLYGAIYLNEIYRYLVDNLLVYVFYRVMVQSGMDLVTTRSQKEWAFGRLRLLNASYIFEGLEDDFPTSILESHRSSEEASNSSKLISIFNSYDALEAASNGQWKAFGGHDSSPLNRFSSRKQHSSNSISRSIRYDMPPNNTLHACGTYDLPQSSYSVFLPEFHRTVTYTVAQSASSVQPIAKLIFNQSNLQVGSGFIDQLSLQNMSELYGYLSWISLPYFLFANASLHNRFNMTPDEESHLPYREFELITGSLWKDATRYQHVLGIRKTDVSVKRSPSLNISYFDQPIPVYWVETLTFFNEVGQERFYARVYHWVSLSCGGLIGLGIFSSFVILFGILTATVTIRDGRIAPMTDDSLS